MCEYRLLLDMFAFSSSGKQQQQQQPAMQVTGGNPRLNQLCSRWQQVWLLALDRQRKLHDALDRLEEVQHFFFFNSNCICYTQRMYNATQYRLISVIV